MIEVMKRIRKRLRLFRQRMRSRRMMMRKRMRRLRIRRYRKGRGGGGRKGGGETRGGEAGAEQRKGRWKINDEVKLRGNTRGRLRGDEIQRLQRLSSLS